MTRRTQSSNPLAAAFAPLKPLLILSLIGIVSLAIAVGVLSPKPVTPQFNPITFAPEDQLVLGTDLTIADWKRDFPEDFQRPNVELHHVYQVRMSGGVTLRRNATLTFPAPASIDLSTNFAAGLPGQLQIAEFLPEARIWSPLPGNFTTRADAFASTTIRGGGTYGLVVILGNQSEELLEANPLINTTEPTKPETPANIPAPDPSRYRFAPMSWIRNGKREDIPTLRICVTPNKAEVRHDDVPSFVTWGRNPPEFKASQSARWYVSEELAEADLPEEVRMLSDPEAFKFRFPQHLPAGEYTVVLRVLDLVDPDRPGVVAEGRIPITIIGD